MFKKIAIIFVVVLALLSVTLFAIPFFFKGKIHAFAENKLTTYLNAKVGFGNVHLSLFRNFPNVSMGLEDIRIVGKGSFAGDTLADVKRVRVVVDIMSIIKGETYEINQIVLEQPQLNVKVNEKGFANWDIVKTDSTTQKQQKTDTSDFRLNLTDYALKNANIKYEDKTQNLKANIRNLTHSGSGKFDQSIYDLFTTTNADTVTVEYAGTRYLNRNTLGAKVDLNINSTTSTYKFLDNEITINDLPLKLSGTVALPDTENIALDLIFSSPQTTFKNLLSLVPGIYTESFKGLQADGKVQFAGFVKGNYNDYSLPAFDVKIQTENGKFQYPKLPQAVSNVNLDLNIASPAGTNLDNLKIDIRKGNAIFGKNPIEVRGKMEGLSKIKLDAVVKGALNLGELTQIFPIEGTDLKGNLDINAKINGIYDTLKKQFPTVDAYLKFQNGYVKNKDYPVILENMSIEGKVKNPNGQFSATEIDLPKFHFDLDKKPFDGKLTVKNLDKPEYDGYVKGSIDLDKIEKIYPLKGMKLAGVFSVDGTAKGVYDEKSHAMPKMSMKMGLENGYVKNDEYKVELKKVNFNGTLTNPQGTMAATVLNLPQLHLEFDNEPIDGKVFIQNLDNPKYDVAMNGNLDLEKITKIYPIEGTKMAGKIKVNQFTTKGSMADVTAKRYTQLPTTGNVQVQNLLYDSKEMGYPIFINSGNGQFSNDKISVSNIVGKAGNTEFGMDGFITNFIGYLFSENGTLGGNLNLTSKKLNINEWMGADDAPKPQGEVIASPEGMSPIEVPANLNVIINTRADEVLYDNLTLKNFNGRINVANKTMAMQNVAFQTLGGNFFVNGLYDSKNLKNPLYGIDLNIQNISVRQAFQYFASVRALAPIAKYLDGNFSTNLKFTGNLDKQMQPIIQDISGLGMLELLNGTLASNPITDKLAGVTQIVDLKNLLFQKIGTKFAVKNGFLEVAPFDVNVKDMKMNVSGKQGLTGALGYLLKLDLPVGKGGQAAQTALSQLTGGIAPVSNRIKLDLELGGTFQNPKITGIKTDAKEQIKDAIKDKAENIIKDKTGVNITLNKDSIKNKVEDIKDRAIEDAKAKAEELKKQAELEAQKKADEIRKKAEEEARKRAEELRKQAEEAKKRAEDSLKKALDKLKNGIKLPWQK